MSKADITDNHDRTGFASMLVLSGNALHKLAAGWYRRYCVVGRASVQSSRDRWVLSLSATSRTAQRSARCSMGDPVPLVADRTQPRARCQFGMRTEAGHARVHHARNQM
jgi:hypothetical protein